MRRRRRVKPVPLTPLEFLIAAQSFDAAVQERVHELTRIHGEAIDLTQTPIYTLPIAIRAPSKKLS